MRLISKYFKWKNEASCVINLLYFIFNTCFQALCGQNSTFVFSTSCITYYQQETYKINDESHTAHGTKRSAAC